MSQPSIFSVSINTQRATLVEAITVDEAIAKYCATRIGMGQPRIVGALETYSNENGEQETQCRITFTRPGRREVVTLFAIKSDVADRTPRWPCCNS